MGVQWNTCDALGYLVRRVATLSNVNLTNSFWLNHAPVLTSYINIKLNEEMAKLKAMLSFHDGLMEQTKRSLNIACYSKG